MKRMRLFLLVIVALACTGSAGYAEGGWPNIGHTEYKGTEHGGMDSTTSYYQDIWAGAQAHKVAAMAKKEPSPPSIAKRDNEDKLQAVESKPDWNPTQGREIKEVDWAPTEGRQIIAPTAVSNMPSSPPNTASVTPVTGAGEDWHKGIKFIWPKAR